MKLTRRGALSCLPAASLLRGQSIGDRAGSVTPIGELANVLEIREIARGKLPDGLYEAVAGPERRMLERITFRPRLLVDTTHLDLSLDLLGGRLFAPILGAPLSGLAVYHPEGEVGLAKGAAASRTLPIISSKSSSPLREIAAAANGPWWYQVFAGGDSEATLGAAQQGLQAGCKAICLTMGGQSGRIGWTSVERLRDRLKAPLVLKGILGPEEAVLAVRHHVDAIVVSNYGAPPGFAEPIEMLPAIAQAVNGRIPILIDGGFRRGTDILKALALGARAVLVGRPLVWGLTVYGALGVQAVLEMLQTELARNMALCGRPDLASIDRTLVKVHSR